VEAWVHVREHAFWRRAHHAEGASHPHAPLRLHPRQHALTGDGARDQHDLAVMLASEGRTAVHHPFYFEFQRALNHGWSVTAADLRRVPEDGWRPLLY